MIGVTFMKQLLRTARARAVIRTRDKRRLKALPDAPVLPHGTDWCWRPDPWQRPLPDPDIASPRSGSVLDHAVKVFHDGPSGAFALRQARSSGAADGTPFALHLDVSEFEGSFLSLVCDLPRTALDGLTRQHIVRLDAVVDLDTPLRVFARLNVEHGPNIEQIVRELPSGDPETVVEFDLAYARFNETRLHRAWIDLIFEAPHRTHAILRDITLSRRLRAAL